MIRNDNPDKGTETLQLAFPAVFLSRQIRNDNPDKVTETTTFRNNRMPMYWIRNDNPDKGTETILIPFKSICFRRLEMITPIRGRKQLVVAKTSKTKPLIRNDNPDKGTETLSATCLSTPSLD